MTFIKHWYDVHPSKLVTQNQLSFLDFRCLYLSQWGVAKNVILRTLKSSWNQRSMSHIIKTCLGFITILTLLFYQARGCSYMFGTTIAMFYKIIKSLTPPYLRNICNLIPHNTNTYNLRRNNSLLVPFIRKEIVSKSFFPKTIREWNNLSLELKESDSINIFKEKLKRLYGPNKSKKALFSWPWLACR